MGKLLIGNLKGPQGEQGAEGKQGKQGFKGARGSRWLSGTAVEGTDTNGQVFATGVADSEVNDYYLNTKTGNLYRCTQSGDEENALWVFVGNIYKFVPEVIDNLESDSETDALSARQGKRICEKIDEKIKSLIEEKGVNVIKLPDVEETYRFRAVIEDKDTTVSWLMEVNGEEIWYEEKHTWTELDNILVIIEKKKMLLPGRTEKLKMIKSSNAKILSLEVEREKTDYLWEAPKIESVYDLKKALVYLQDTFEISDEDTEEQKYHAANIRAWINDDTQDAVFPISHAKAIWWNAMAEKTVFDKITELEKLLDELKSKVEQIPSVTYGTSEPNDSDGNDGDVYIKITEE